MSIEPSLISCARDDQKRPCVLRRGWRLRWVQPQALGPCPKPYQLTPHRPSSRALWILGREAGAISSTHPTAQGQVWSPLWSTDLEEARVRAQGEVLPCNRLTQASFLAPHMDQQVPQGRGQSCRGTPAFAVTRDPPEKEHRQGHHRHQCQCPGRSKQGPPGQCPRCPPL